MYHPYRRPKPRHWAQPGIGPVFGEDQHFDYITTEDDIAISTEASDFDYLIVER